MTYTFKAGKGISLKGDKLWLNHSFTLKQSLIWWGGSLTLLLLGAHFFRAGEYGLALCSLGMLIFNCSLSSWKNYAVALFLFWGALEWFLTAYNLMDLRRQMAVPWLRGALILAAVALLTALSAGLSYGRAGGLAEVGDSGPRFKALIFMAAFLSLSFTRNMAAQAGLQVLLLERYFPLWGSVELFFAAWYAAFIAGLLLNDQRGEKRKKIWLIFTGVFFGQLILGLAGFEKMLMSGKLHIPLPAFIIFSPVYRGEVSFFMPLLLVLSVILAGSTWCSFLCYFGSLNTKADSGLKKAAPPSKFLDFILKYGRLLVLLTGVSVALGLRLSGAPLSLALSLALVFGLISFLALIYLSGRYGGLIHCTAFCPIGLVVNVLARLSPWRIKVDPARCTNCGACEKICVYRAIEAESRQKGRTNLRCSMCRDCLNHCSKKAIYLWNPLLPAQLRLFGLVGLAVILHVLFLVTARV